MARTTEPDYVEDSPRNAGGKHTDTQDSDDGSHNVLLLDLTNQKPVRETRRFALMTLACFGMICASTSYAFNLFSVSLQNTYNYDSRQMATINTVGMVFCYFLLPYGFTYDYLGPRPVYALACVLAPLGLLLMGLTFQGKLQGSVVRFCVYNALLSLGSQLFDLATVVTMLSVFPTKRGWVVALLKTLMGLGSAIIGSIRVGFFSKSPANYFFFLVGMVLAIGLVCLATIRLPSYHLTGYEQSHLSEEEKRVRAARFGAYLVKKPPMWRFYVGIAVILLLVVYLPTTSAVAAFVKPPTSTIRNFAIVTVVLACCFLLMMVPCPFLDRLTTKRSKAGHASSGDADLEMDGESGESSNKPAGGEVLTDIDYIPPAFQTTFWQSCCTVRLWCILWTMFCGVGAEFVIIFNASTIFQALTEQPELALTVSALLTVLNGAGSAIGRLVMSLFEGYTQKRKAEDRIPITIAFFVPTALIIISLVLFLVLPGRSLLLAFAIAALGNGFCASITILVIRTMYAKDAAKHYNFGYNALWIAAILLNRLLFGEWIATRAEKQGVKKCMGKSCVMMPMLVMIGLNVTAMLSDVYVHFSYVRFSRKVLAERRRIKEEGVLNAEPISSEKPPVVMTGEIAEEDSGSLHDSLDHLDNRVSRE